MFRWVRVVRNAYVHFAHCGGVFLFEFPTALVRFVGLLGGEEAVSVAARGRAKAVE